MGDAPEPSQVAWEALSPQGRRALAQIAVPLSLGLSHQEIAQRLGVSSTAVSTRMRLLRRELVEQADQRR